MLYGDLKAKKLSPQRYISGRLALSIEAEAGDSGDWRSAAALWNEKAKMPRYGVMGQGERYDTTPYLGSQGVAEVSDRLLKMGLPNLGDEIYAASHPRAVADMVLANALDGKSFAAVTMESFDEWLGEEKDKQIVYAMLRSALPKLPKSAGEFVEGWLLTAMREKFDRI